jgi:hypothetical protein
MQTEKLATHDNKSKVWLPDHSCILII